MNSSVKILIADDEERWRRLVGDFLRNEGYKTVEAANGQEAVELIRQDSDISMAILDIMMPGIDGLEVCREIRKTSNIPILILSAKAEDMDKIVGFGTGADDYLTKPFHPLELLARVKSQMKRYTTIQLGEEQQSAGKDEIEIQDLTINKAAHVVKKNGKEKE